MFGIIRYLVMDSFPFASMVVYAVICILRVSVCFALGGYLVWKLVIVVRFTSWINVTACARAGCVCSANEAFVSTGASVIAPTFDLMPREEEEGFGAVDGPLVEEEVFSSVSTSGNMNAEAFAAISIEALVADDHATAVAFVAQDGRDTVATDKSDEMLIAHAFTVEETSAAPSGDSAEITVTAAFDVLTNAAPAITAVHGDSSSGVTQSFITAFTETSVVTPEDVTAPDGVAPKVPESESHQSHSASSPEVHVDASASSATDFGVEKDRLKGVLAPVVDAPLSGEEVTGADPAMPHNEVVHEEEGCGTRHFMPLDEEFPSISTFGSKTAQALIDAPVDDVTADSIVVLDGGDTVPTELESIETLAHGFAMEATETVTPVDTAAMDASREDGGVNAVVSSAVDGSAVDGCDEYQGASLAEHGIDRRGVDGSQLIMDDLGTFPAPLLEKEVPPLLTYGPEAAQVLTAVTIKALEVVLDNHATADDAGPYAGARIDIELESSKILVDSWNFAITPGKAAEGTIDTADGGDPASESTHAFTTTAPVGAPSGNKFEGITAASEGGNAVPPDDAMEVLHDIDSMTELLEHMPTAFDADKAEVPALSETVALISEVPIGVNGGSPWRAVSESESNLAFTFASETLVDTPSEPAKVDAIIASDDWATVPPEPELSPAFITQGCTIEETDVAPFGGSTDIAASTADGVLAIAKPDNNVLASLWLIVARCVDLVSWALKISSGCQNATEHCLLKFMKRVQGILLETVVGNSIDVVALYRAARMSALKPIVTALATLHNQVLVLPLLEAREHLHHYFPSPEDVAPMVLALREALEQLVVIPLIFTSNHVACLRRNMFKIEDYMESLFVDAVAIEFSAIVTNSMDDHEAVIKLLNLLRKGSSHEAHLAIIADFKEIRQRTSCLSFASEESSTAIVTPYLRNKTVRDEADLMPLSKHLGVDLSVLVKKRFDPSIINILTLFVNNPQVKEIVSGLRGLAQLYNLACIEASSPKYTEIVDQIQPLLDVLLEFPCFADVQDGPIPACNALLLMLGVIACNAIDAAVELAVLLESLNSGPFVKLFELMDLPVMADSLRALKNRIEDAYFLAATVLVLPLSEQPKFKEKILGLKEVEDLKKQCRSNEKFNNFLQRAMKGDPVLFDELIESLRILNSELEAKDDQLKAVTAELEVKANKLVELNSKLFQSEVSVESAAVVKSNVGETIMEDMPLVETADPCKWLTETMYLQSSNETVSNLVQLVAIPCGEEGLEWERQGVRLSPNDIGGCRLKFLASVALAVDENVRSVTNTTAFLGEAKGTSDNIFPIKVQSVVNVNTVRRVQAAEGNTNALTLTQETRYREVEMVPPVVETRDEQQFKIALGGSQRVPTREIDSSIGAAISVQILEEPLPSRISTRDSNLTVPVPTRMLSTPQCAGKQPLLGTDSCAASLRIAEKESSIGEVVPRALFTIATVGQRAIVADAPRIRAFHGFTLLGIFERCFTRKANHPLDKDAWWKDIRMVIIAHGGHVIAQAKDGNYRTMKNYCINQSQAKVTFSDAENGAAYFRTEVQRERALAKFVFAIENFAVMQNAWISGV